VAPVGLLPDLSKKLTIPHIPFTTEKAICLETQQAIREILIEIKEPRPWDESFPEGLSPPEKLIKRHRDPSRISILWRALAMLLLGSKTLSANPCILMARARTKSESRNCRFLLS
jgi:hypothetical protein